MKNEGFSIICNKCGNSIDIKASHATIDKNKISFFLVQNYCVNIVCNNCDNEIYVDE